jgi:hypothetical protein
MFRVSKIQKGWLLGGMALAVLLLGGYLFARETVKVSRAPSMAASVLKNYDRYREHAIEDRRFKHEELIPLLQKAAGHRLVEMTQVGSSIEGRSIHQLRLGNGPVKVLLWSQMHGDEATATMAILDLLNFFSASDEFDPLRELILDNLSLYFIPMLNPDGAERHQRRNALDVDLNRDALRLQTPEARILKSAVDRLQPKWGFNLHDQSRYYAAGQHPHTATFSFLAPAFNVAKDVDPVRLRSMQLIADLKDWLQPLAAGKVARYDDSFEPRAFGDNIQKWGTSTILVECGGLENDPEKQTIRKWHFGLLLKAFESIVRCDYEAYDRDDYEEIPYNSRRFFDLLLREVIWEYEGKDYRVDMGFYRAERTYEDDRNMYFAGYISDLGDLSTHFGYQELAAGQWRAVPGKMHPRIFETMSQLRKMDLAPLHRQGYTDVRVQKYPGRPGFDDFPLWLHKSGTKQVKNTIGMGKNPSLVLYRGDQAEFVVVNGKLFPIE